MTYTMRRDQIWTIKVDRQLRGWRYHATPCVVGQENWVNTDISGWSAGNLSDLWDTVRDHIDKIQGPPKYCELPRKVKEVRNG